MIHHIYWIRCLFELLLLSYIKFAKKKNKIKNQNKQTNPPIHIIYERQNEIN